MNAAHHQELGRPITVTDAYRDYPTQVALARRKPHLAATPGTSVHGRGLAVDLAVDGWHGDASNGCKPTRTATAGTPHLAQRHGSKPEPWHGEYTSAAPQPPPASSP